MSRKFLFLKVFTMILISQIAIANQIPGYLAPREEGDGPATTVWADTYERPNTFQKRAFTELLDFVLPSPNQEDAGTCLYMAHTGNVEWWLNKLKGKRAPLSEGGTDISERHLMYLSRTSLASRISNPLTDSVYLFNLNRQKAHLNRDYRFTKGWYTFQNGRYQKARPHDSGASYSTNYNWIFETPSSQAATVRLPKFERDIIFKDPKDNRWAINTMPRNIVERIKTKLRQKKAPVLVVYNHYLIWHAVMIVGYDDQESTEGCKFTTGFVDYTKQLADKAQQNGQSSQARFYRAQSQAVDRAQQAEGGCQDKGVFLVRDSIYDWPGGPIYDFDPTQAGEETSYSAPIVKKEYQWLKRFGNHAIQIYAVGEN